MKWNLDNIKSYKYVKNGDIKHIKLIIALFNSPKMLVVLCNNKKVSIKYDASGFDECLFVHLSVIIILHCIAYFVITYINMHFL